MDVNWDKVLKDLPKRESSVEILPEVRAWANMTYSYLSSLTEVGFTRSEAMDLVKFQIKIANEQGRD